jgi:hypothetical protein
MSDMVVNPCKPVIPAFRRRKKDREFETRLVYTGRPVSKRKYK